MLDSIKYLGLLMLLLACSQCGQPNEEQADSTSVQDGLFRYMESSKTGISFINEVRDQEQFNVLTYRNFYNGGGVGIGDFNNDGLDDIYFTANMESNKLYLNKGDMQFDDITSSAGVEGHTGWSTGVSIVDINADGHMDIYVSNSGDPAEGSRKNELFINNGDLTFTESAKKYNLDNEGYSTHAAFFDYDGDGDLDCYILNNSFKDPSRIDIYSRTREENDELGGDRLMRNDNGTFTDVSASAGIYSSAIGFGLGVSIGDLNNDLWPDIYISNDFFERDYLYINNQDGTFSEELTERVSICSVSSMGADIADINNDGYPDIFSTDMLAADNYRLKAATLFDAYHLEDLKFRSSYHYQILQNCLQINRGGKSFREIGSLSGVSATDWSWGALIFDFDNDSYKDIYVCNGIYHDIMYLDFANFIDDKEEVKKVVEEKGRYDFRDFLEFLPSNPIDNYAFVNDGALNFSNQAQALGFKKGEFSNGSAYSDLDNDGDLDIVINNINMPASIYQNQSNQAINRSITLALKGDNQNPNAVGTKVIVSLEGKEITQELYLNRGFQSSVTANLVIGIGDATTINHIDVIWPDRTQQRINNPKISDKIVIDKEANIPNAIVKGSSKNDAIKDISSVIQGGAKHTENIFNDFDIETLLPRMHSTEGPKVVVADVNGDGKDDFLTLGADGDSDKLFLQTTNGKFKRAPAPALDADKSFESTAAVFLDADNDGDQDLLIGAGGNQLSKGIESFMLRYYENDGSGNYTRQDSKAPRGAGQVSSIACGDIDKDGDIDIFVGGRSIPGNYGIAPRSFVFRNEGNGAWTDITSQEIGTVGMTTDAIWSDIDRDDDLDLMIVGEWMPITVFVNENGKLENQRTVPDSHGWWLDINEADLNGDGINEYLLGNWGKNSKFQASKEAPLSMHLKDFDNNGKTEFIMNWYPPIDDKPYPFASKMDITSQLPHLKKKVLKYEDYATKDYNSLLTEEERAGTTDFICQTLSTSILDVSSNTPRLISLNNAAQLSPTFAIAPVDHNQDGKMDLWLGGNFYGLKPEAGHLDGSRGVLLENQGNLNFSEVPNNPDITTGEVRDAKTIKINGEQALLVARNNQTLQLLSFD